MTHVSLASTVTTTDHVTATTIDDEVVLLNDDTGLYQGLQGVGPRIWELIQEPTTVEAVADTIATEYDVDRDRCEQDVLDFVETLADENLVEFDDRPTP
jgi:hypothetical protein